jgi:hypothetical protein
MILVRQAIDASLQLNFWCLMSLLAFTARVCCLLMTPDAPVSDLCNRSSLGTDFAKQVVIGLLDMDGLHGWMDKYEQKQTFGLVTSTVPLYFPDSSNR